MLGIKKMYNISKRGLIYMNTFRKALMIALVTLAGQVQAQDPAQGTAVQGAPVQGAPAQGTAVQGAPVQGAPVQGAPVQGAPVQGAPVQGAPVQGAPSTTTTAATTLGGITAYLAAAGAKLEYGVWRVVDLFGYSPIFYLINKISPVNEAAVAAGTAGYFGVSTQLLISRAITLSALTAGIAYACSQLTAQDDDELDLETRQPYTFNR